MVPLNLIKLFRCLCGVLLPFSAGALDESALLHSEAVRFDDHRDGARIDLKDGRSLYLDDIIYYENEVARLWQSEIKRIYARLKQEHPSDSQMIGEVELKWLDFMAGELALIRLTYDQEGSLYPLLAAQARLQLVRSHALHIAKYGRQN